MLFSVNYFETPALCSYVICKLNQPNKTTRTHAYEITPQTCYKQQHKQIYNIRYAIRFAPISSQQLQPFSLQQSTVPSTTIPFQRFVRTQFSVILRLCIVKTVPTVSYNTSSSTTTFKSRWRYGRRQMADNQNEDEQAQLLGEEAGMRASQPGQNLKLG